METTAVSPLDWYQQHVLPALAERLDTAFPEFAFKRDSRGWVATNQDATRRAFGVRADRVVCHGHAPPGFLIHGADPISFTSYLNQGETPRGKDFVATIRELAARAGIDTTPLDQQRPADRRTRLFESYQQLCKRELHGERGRVARAYLHNRGISLDGSGGAGLGLAPPAQEARAALREEGYSDREITQTRVLSDSRWPGRLTGAWRAAGGAIGTIWARSLDPADSDRYLYLAGARRTGLPPYGLERARTHGDLEELVIVEGVLDVHQLRTRGITNVAALGSTSARPETFERLDRLGIQSVVLALDNDQPGRRATVRAIDAAHRATQAPEIRLIAPEHYGEHKDPGEHLDAHGPDALLNLIREAEDAIAWRTRDLLGPDHTRTTDSSRRAALNRAGRWLATLPARLALEQEDAIKLAANATGYDPATVTRAFHARYWKPEPARQQQCGIGVGR